MSHNNRDIVYKSHVLDLGSIHRYRYSVLERCSDLQELSRRCRK